MEPTKTTDSLDRRKKLFGFIYGRTERDSRGGAKNTYAAITLQHEFMLQFHVAISCCDQLSIFQLDFPFLLLSISQYLAICIYHCLFQLDFPFLLRSISQNWNSALTSAFLGWISYFNHRVFPEIGNLHLPMPFLMTNCS